MMRLARWKTWGIAVAFAVACTVASSVAAQVVRQNLADLTNLARDIVVGTVIAVDDGISAEKVPYTEVTVALDRTVKGKLAGTYTFRQFGLRQPRLGADGLINVMVTPEGWPRYVLGSEVMLFLYKPASRTGLRTTVGLDQGYFRIEDGEILSGTGNAGLFDGVDLPPARRARLDAILPAGVSRPLLAASFIDLVETAVREDWFEAPR